MQHAGRLAQLCGRSCCSRAPTAAALGTSTSGSRSRQLLLGRSLAAVADSSSQLPAAAGQQQQQHPGCSAMDADVERLVRAIHAAPQQAVIYTTGGASQGTAWLLSVPGASGTVLEVVVPYGRASLVELLGGQEPAQYCSADAALALSAAAFRRAVSLSRFGAPVVGLAASCALASEPPKRGEHRLYVAATSSAGTRLRSLTLAKGRRTRLQEEDVAGRLLARVLAEACGLQAEAERLPLGLLQPSAAGSCAGDVAGPEQHTPPPAEPLADLVAGRVRCVEFSGGRVLVDAPRGGPGRVYLPGSFNPLHEGHTAMLQAAVQLAGPHTEGCFELTAVNADKGPLGVADIQRRVAQFVAAGLPVVVTTARLLVDKARLLPGSTFVVGWDTAARIVMPKYYGDSEAGMAAVLADICARGCHFLVAGRRDEAGGGDFKTLADIPLPPAAPGGLFRPIPEDAFRADVSSTALRAAGKGLPEL